VRCAAKQPWFSFAIQNYLHPLIDKVSGLYPEAVKTIALTKVAFNHHKFHRCVSTALQNTNFVHQLVQVPTPAYSTLPGKPEPRSGDVSSAPKVDSMLLPAAQAMAQVNLFASVSKSRLCHAAVAQPTKNRLNKIVTFLNPSDLFSVLTISIPSSNS